MKKIHFLLLLLSLQCLTACVHRPDIEQGNIVTPTQLRQLHEGMTKTEVRELLGSPVLSVPFNRNRLEYAYTLQKGRTTGTGKRLTLLFRNDKLVKIQREDSFFLPH